ncbi:hypothetical protein [Propionicimonas sp.]|uniref:hypothetical protein n=1 Tax=Propionicimonas sp. TaxID=1955623 RepID=UPI0018249A67|nr:hypothetical protein [Propionicimonas sp.]MBU3975814.1 hypothetical protein [Actinomycetota bacterium]MBA3022197.1 hypothetical protein [Propionicimonas sp.]MBU3987364.1 hypothetical protein [Actinomycetota bacterium]MBU4006417.1 hypothetical protein [Actinomycetota bacterium]MBU4065296.1 hypothetical protein [Actinomycetota bacterium]
MKSNAFVIAATSVAIISSSVWSLPANAAPNPAPNAPTATVVKTVRVDVDGDGKSDDVRVSDLGGDRFQVTATTAKATSSITFELGYAARAQWYGAAKLDGVKGKELILSAEGANPRYRIFTWRKGALVAESFPPGLKNDVGWSYWGYRFFTVGKRSYAEYMSLGKVRKNGIDDVKITRSAWRNGKWVKRYTSIVRKSASKVLVSQGIVASVYVGKASIDVDGDGKLDAVTERKPNGITTTWTVVSATGKKFSYTSRYGSLEGIADVDGLPGAEFIIDTGTEARLWSVLSWDRGSKKFLALPSPEGSRSWRQFSDYHRSMNYEFAEVSGKRQLKVIEIDGVSDQVFFTTYLREPGNWSKTKSWTETLDSAARDALCHGFCGVKLTRP